MTTGFCGETTARSVSRVMNSRVALMTQPAWLGPMGAIWMISPSISSTRSSSPRMPASAIR
jgi:hypothetical protein